MDGVLIAVGAVAVGLAARLFVPDEHHKRVHGLGPALIGAGLVMVAAALLLSAL